MYSYRKTRYYIIIVYRAQLTRRSEFLNLFITRARRYTVYNLYSKVDYRGPERYRFLMTCAIFERELTYELQLFM